MARRVIIANDVVFNTVPTIPVLHSMRNRGDVYIVQSGDLKVLDEEGIPYEDITENFINVMLERYANDYFIFRDHYAERMKRYEDDVMEHGFDFPKRLSAFNKLYFIKDAILETLILSNSRIIMIDERGIGGFSWGGGRLMLLVAPETIDDVECRKCWVVKPNGNVIVML